MTVYVFGLGHVGLPLAAWIALSGQEVIGIDINKDLTDKILQGNVEIHEYYNGIHIAQLVYNLIKSGSLKIGNQFERIDFSPAIFVCSVGIGITKDGKQDISPLQLVLDHILPNLVPGDLLLFRTTMIPGFCETLIAPQLKKNRISRPLSLLS